MLHWQLWLPGRRFLEYETRSNGCYRVGNVRSLPVIYSESSRTDIILVVLAEELANLDSLISQPQVGMKFSLDSH